MAEVSLGMKDKDNNMNKQYGVPALKKKLVSSRTDLSLKKIFRTVVLLK